MAQRCATSSPSRFSSKTANKPRSRPPSAVQLAEKLPRPASLVTAHDFTGWRRTLAKGSFVTGRERGTHPVGGSRALRAAKSMRALVPEGKFSQAGPLPDARAACTLALRRRRYPGTVHDKPAFREQSAIENPEILCWAYGAIRPNVVGPPSVLPRQVVHSG